MLWTARAFTIYIVGRIIGKGIYYGREFLLFLNHCFCGKFHCYVAWIISFSSHFFYINIKRWEFFMLTFFKEKKFGKCLVSSKFMLTFASLR